MSVRKKIVDVSKATYSAVESRLSGVFKTVPPRREFVRGLGHQIQVHPPATSHRLTDLHFVLIVIAGFAGGGGSLGRNKYVTILVIAAPTASRIRNKGCPYQGTPR